MVLSGLAAVKRVDSTCRAALEQASAVRLATLLNHVRRTVSFFRDAMAGVGAIDAANAREVLAQLPVMRRSDIQANPKAFLSSEAGAYTDDATGGSTGTPMAFKVDGATQRAREASLMWANNLAGWRTGERIAMLWGSDRDVQSASRKLRLVVRWWIENMRWYNAFDMGEDRMAEFHKALSTFRPHLLVAYAGSAFTFARFLKSRGWHPAYPLKAIITSAEVCAPAMRTVVEEVFGKPVFDRYGNREFGAIAAECEAHQGLHVNELDCIVEIDSPAPFKQEGPIIMTYLKNRVMPFIRYDTGDVGRLESREPCRCGRTTIRLAPVTGRQSDTIRTASGKLIHGEYFTHLLYGARGVNEFQFIQESLKSYRLLVVGDPELVAATKESWRQRILKAIGPDCELVIEFVPQIPALPSGKRKFILSELSVLGG